MATDLTNCGGVTSRTFGLLPDGRNVTEYTLTNASGMRARILDFGGIIRELAVPDSEGVLADIVLGFDNLDSYVSRHPYFGAIIGRYAGRIAKGQFAIGDTRFALTVNSGENHLHGGKDGFDRAVWSARCLEHPARLILSHVSPDGDEGYPGELILQVTYTLTDDALRIEYEATTDATTVINLTQHTYFNLAGRDSVDVLDHVLQVSADSTLELDEELIPTGTMVPVAGTPLDFRQPRRMGQEIDAGHPQLAIANGYDHNWVLSGDDHEVAAVLLEPVSGRRLEVQTTEPGIQIYSGNFFDGSVVGKGGRAYGKNAGIALETQHFPDSPNHPGFPSTELRAGETFRSETIFRFSTVGAAQQ